MGDATKQCTKCRVEKPVESFWRDRTRSDGRFPQFNACASDRPVDRDARQRRAAEWRKKNPERAKEGVRRWKQQNQARVSAAEAERYRRDAARLKEKARTYYAANREAVSERLARPEVRERRRNYQRLWRERNRSYWKKWRDANPEKALALVHRRLARLRDAAGADYTTPEKIRDRIRFHGHRCYYCKGPYEAIDHRIPLARGGPHLPGNIVPACKSCNSRKNTKTEREFKRIK
jgi:5-methylcytosine-specific restriction endonuclease McrA